MVEVGFKIGLLEVVELLENKTVRCVCKCGGEIIVGIYKITRKHEPRRSCGCLRPKNGIKPRVPMMGKRYNYMEVVEEMPLGTIGRKEVCVRCLCHACGDDTWIGRAYDVRKGRIKTCCRGNLVGIGTNFKHGLSKTPAFKKWVGMKARCVKEDGPESKWYYEKGIIVEEPWLSDAAMFCKWYEDNCKGDYTLQIDRIDNDGNYSEKNCRLVSSQVNNCNKSTNLIITAFGETKPLIELIVKYSKVNESTVRHRIRKSGWHPEDAMTVLPGHKRPKRDAEGNLINE